MPTYDLVIKGGTVIDGLQTPRFKADVAIADGRIVQIGRVSAADGREVVDASGKVVAPGVVDTPLHKDNPKNLLQTFNPMGSLSDSKDIADAVVYLTEARHVTGEVLHVDGGAHVGRW